jgi:hypothetical protein
MRSKGKFGDRKIRIKTNRYALGLHLLLLALVVVIFIWTLAYMIFFNGPVTSSDIIHYIFIYFTEAVGAVPTSCFLIKGPRSKHDRNIALCCSYFSMFTNGMIMIVEFPRVRRNRALPLIIFRNIFFLTTALFSSACVFFCKNRIIRRRLLPHRRVFEIQRQVIDKLESPEMFTVDLNSDVASPAPRAGSVLSEATVLMYSDDSEDGFDEFADSNRHSRVSSLASILSE